MIIFRMRLRLGIGGKRLGRQFGIKRLAVQSIFLAVSTCYYGVSNQIPKKWTKQLTNAEKNEVYAHMIKDMDPFYQRLVSR